jgi:hypothetical protein
LGLSLVLLIGMVTWAVWPLNEEQLYARAKVLMDTEDISNWRTAREEYIEAMLAIGFPEGKYHVEAAQWIDKIEMDIAKAPDRQPPGAGTRSQIRGREAVCAGD